MQGDAAPASFVRESGRWIWGDDRAATVASGATYAPFVVVEASEGRGRGANYGIVGVGAVKIATDGAEATVVGRANASRLGADLCRRAPHRVGPSVALGVPQGTSPALAA